MNELLILNISCFFIIIFNICDSYKVIIKKQYKTTYIILAVNLLLVLIIIILMRTSPIYSLYNLTIKLLCLWGVLQATSAFLKSNRFKR